MTSAAERFPMNVTTYAQGVVASAASKADAEENARALGQRQACAWVLALYSLGETPTNVPLLPTVDLPVRPSKAAFARLVGKTVAKFESTYEFSAYNGWNQVKGKGVEINQAYGVYDMLNMIMEIFDLWIKLPHEEVV